MRKPPPGRRGILLAQNPQKKNGLEVQQPRRWPVQQNTMTPSVMPAGHEWTVTVGLDVGDRYSHFYVVDTEGRRVEDGRVATTPDVIERWCRVMLRARIIVESSTHSPWISRIVQAWGHRSEERRVGKECRSRWS